MAECNNSVNYALVSSTPGLPFVFTLDTDNSILVPEEGQNQRFCYRIQGVGSDTSAFTDLSHFVLGVCGTLSEADILSAEVIIDGVAQSVVLGENVEVRSEASPDPTTGCAGLKFDFGLRKNGGVMLICFSLARVFDVGPVVVCVNGGQTSLSGLAICGPACGTSEACRNVVTQRMTVCVPVTVTPWARAGTVETTCCGEPVIAAGTGECEGEVNASCSFTISQELCVDIPLAFGATADPGEASVLCGEAEPE